MTTDPMPPETTQPTADSPPSTPSGALHNEASGKTVLPIKFNGIGNEYFSIWIVNLLLMMVTLGLYYPWARVRKLVYFAQSTEVGGYPLSFHGKAKQMFVPFIIAVILIITYQIASSALPVLAVGLIVIFGLSWPWLFRAANRFRLGKTEWRGLRLGFVGTTLGAYKAFLIPVFVVVAMSVAFQLLGLADPNVEDLEDEKAKEHLTLVGLVVGVFTLINMLLFPLFTYIFKRYQHNNFAYASLKTQFSARLRDFYILFIKTIGFAIIALIAVVAPIVLLYLAVFGMTFAIGDAGGAMIALFVFLFIALFVLMRFYFTVVSTFWNAGMFNLLWPNTRTGKTQFKSQLTFFKLLKVTIINAILITLTMGIYLPFAQLALARVKLHSLHIETEDNIEEIIADVRSGKTSAAADIAADVLDIDIGI